MRRPLTASIALAMMPFDLAPLRFEDDRLPADREAELFELFADDPDFVDRDALLAPLLLADEPDLDADRDDELAPLLFDPDDPEPVFDDLDAPPLLFVDFDDDADALDLDPEDPDFEPLAELLPLLFFALEPLDEDLLVEPEEADLLDDDPDLDFAPDVDDFALAPDDFAPPALELAAFEGPVFEVDDFLVVAILFLRVIEQIVKRTDSVSANFMPCDKKRIFVIWKTNLAPNSYA